MSTLVVCVVGVIVSYVAYHLLFERMISQGTKTSEIGRLSIATLILRHYIVIRFNPAVQYTEFWSLVCSASVQGQKA